MSGAGNRHIGQQGLDDYLAAGVRASIPIAGRPEARLTVDSANETIRLEVSWDGVDPPNVRNYAHLSTDVRFDQQQNWAAVAVHGRRFFAEAYPLLRSVADLVQLRGLSFADAVTSSLASYHELLAATGPMSARDEIGLFGELMVLSHLIDSMGADHALKAWRGGDQKEEHDFGLEEHDIEVKTTTADSRRHWIGSLNQLRPTIDRPLWLVSIQLTDAGVSHAQRLPDLVGLIEQQLSIPLQGIFGRRLTTAGFHLDQPTDSYRLLRLRTAPACFLVEGKFPRIDREILNSGGAVVSRIGEVSYTIELDGLDPSPEPPLALKSFLGSKHG